MRWMTRLRPWRLRSHRQGGFSLMELLIGLAVLTVLMAAVLQLFESSTQVASTQLEQADLQQAVRVALEDIIRQTRLLGRGGLLAVRGRAAGGEVWNDIRCPAGACDGTQPIGLAMRVDNNVADGYHVVKGDNASPLVVPGTDVLTVRGIFNSAVYLVRYSDAASFTLVKDAGGDYISGQVIIENITPIGDVAQDLSFFNDIKTENRPEAVLLMSPFSDTVFGIAQFDAANSSMDVSGERFTLAFTLDPTQKHAAAYQTGSANAVFPGDVLSQSRVGSVGIIEEYRYYVRTGAEPGFEGVAGIADRLRLSRTRAYPGMEGEDANYPTKDDPTHLDLADDVLDFQVSFGFDPALIAPDGSVVHRGEFPETDDGAGALDVDAWYGNNLADTAPTLDEWTKELSVARLSIIARSRTQHRGHQAPQILRLEDHDYTGGDPSDPDDINSYESRLYLRFTLQSLVEMRNL